MSVIEILTLALILATDAFIVSFSYGICNLRHYKKSAILLASGTGIFQCLMPIIGALFTSLIFSLIQSYAKNLAGIIFIIIGVKMCFETQGKTENDKNHEIIEISLKTIFLISIATSIDALAAGSSLFLMKADIYLASILIGIITFFLSLFGFALGKSFKKIAPELLSKLAGAIFIILGLKSIFL